MDIYKYVSCMFGNPKLFMAMYSAIISASDCWSKPSIG